MAEHLDDVAIYVSGEDTSELAKTKAELAYALSALDREMDLCRQAEARLAEAVKAFEDYGEHADSCEAKYKSKRECTCDFREVYGRVVGPSRKGAE